VEEGAEHLGVEVEDEPGFFGEESQVLDVAVGEDGESGGELLVGPGDAGGADHLDPVAVLHERGDVALDALDRAPVSGQVVERDDEADGAPGGVAACLSQLMHSDHLVDSADRV